MQLVYSGAHPEALVEVDDPTLGFVQIDVVANEPTEIPDSIAVRLLEQNTWAKATAKQAKAAAAPATPSDPAPSDDATKGSN